MAALEARAGAPALRPPLADLADLVEHLRLGRAVLCLGERLASGAPLLARLGDLVDALSAPEAAEARQVIERRPLWLARWLRGRLGERFAWAGEPAEPARLLQELPFRAKIAAARLLAGETEPGWRNRSWLLVGFEPEDAELDLVLSILPTPEGFEHYLLLPGHTDIEREELWARHGVRVLAETDPLHLARALRAAIGPGAGGIDRDPQALLAALAEDPSRQDLLVRLDELERKLRWAEDYDALVELQLGRLGLEPDADRRAAILDDLVRLFRLEVGDLNKAFSALLYRYCEMPRRDTWTALGELADATERWPELLSEFSEAVPDLPAEDRADAHVFLAQRWDEVIGDVDRALEATASALTLDPDHEEAFTLRMGLLRRTERHREIVEMLVRQAESERPTDERTSALLEAADLSERRLGDSAAATAAWRRALEIDPWCTAARDRLEALYRAEGREAELVEILEQKLDGATADEQVPIRRELAALFERRGDLDATIARWEELRAGAPGDLEILRELERLYERKGSVRELCEILAAQAGVVEGHRERAVLYRRMAKLAEEELADRGRAEEYLEWLLNYEGPADETFRDLERLYAADGRWRAAIDTYSRHAAMLPGPARAALFVEVAGIYERELKDVARTVDLTLRAEEAQPGYGPAAAELARLLGQGAVLDPEIAEGVFLRTIEADPAHVAALCALATLYKSRDELLKASRLLTQASEHAELPSERTRLKFEAAELLELLTDRSGAIPLYLDAVGADPDHEQAADRASQLLWNAGRFREVLPILELLVRKEAAPALKLRRLARLAEAALKAGETEKAVKAWSRALEIDPVHIDALRGRVEFLYAAEKWEEAQAALLALEKAHGGGLAPSERGEVLYRLASCALRLRRKDEAAERAAAALAADPAHRQALLLRLELRLDDSNIPAGELVGQVLTIAPDDHRLLHRVLDRCATAGEWEGSLALLSRLVDLEKDPRVRARYAEAAGLVHLEELGRPEKAMPLLEEALAADPALTAAAEALERILRERKDWTALANHYYRLLSFLGPENGDGRQPERARLWSGLGELCLAELGDAAAALIALESAVQLDPSNLARRERLAHLYVQAGPDAFDKAIAEHQAILRSDHGRRESYGTLADLYFRTGRPARARACRDALALLEKRPLDPPPARLPVLRRPLDADGWMRLRHPDEDRLLGIWAPLVAPFVATSQARTARELGLDRDTLVAPDDNRPFSQALRAAAMALGVAPPEVHIQREQRVPLSVVLRRSRRAAAPVLLVGLPMLGDRRPERELVFPLARHLACLRPERLLRLLLPEPQMLTHLVRATMALGAAEDGEAQTPTAQLARTIESLRKMLTPVALDQLATVGHRLRARSASSEDVAKTWLCATDGTASRAALLLTGDLAGCARLCESDPEWPGAPSRADRVLDLLWSSVTQEMLDLREQLGLDPPRLP